MLIGGDAAKNQTAEIQIDPLPKCLFIIVEKEKNGMDMRAQLQKKI